MFVPVCVVPACACACARSRAPRCDDSRDVAAVVSAASTWSQFRAARRPRTRPGTGVTATTTTTVGDDGDDGCAHDAHACDEQDDDETKFYRRFRVSPRYDDENEARTRCVSTQLLPHDARDVKDLMWLTARTDSRMMSLTHTYT